MQEYVTILHSDARIFAKLPFPSRIYVGKPGVPYGVFESMLRATSFEVGPSPDIDPASNGGASSWPLYRMTMPDESIHTIGADERTGPLTTGPSDEWFLFASRPGIDAVNDPPRWMPFFTEAIEKNPEGVVEWAYGEQMLAHAGLVLSEMGHSDLALDLLRKVLESWPGSASGMLYTGLHMQRVGRKSDAVTYLNAFLSQHPNDPRAADVTKLVESIETLGR